jgi:hypothetical protein
MFIVRHRAYVDHPVAMSRAMRSASLFYYEIECVLKEIIRTYGESTQRPAE